jgi:hypothetical protein
MFSRLSSFEQNSDRLISVIPRFPGDRAMLAPAILYLQAVFRFKPSLDVSLHGWDK